MKRFVYTPTVITTLLVVVVGCTSISPAPSPTTGVQTQTETVMVPDTETPSISTPTQTLTATLAANGTSVPTFTLSPTATVCATPSKGITYIVQQGDTLNQIALRYNMSAEELQLANCLASADTIFAGQTIYVPFYLPPVLIQPTRVPPVSAQTVIPPDLKSVIAFDPGGANKPPTCDGPVGTDFQITFSERVNDKYQLCVYGFTSGEEVSVELNGPGGRHFVSAGNTSGGTVIRILLWMPIGMPTGPWSAVAHALSSNKSAEYSFDINPIEEAAINIVPVGEINPFEDTKKCGFYSPGEELIIRGTHFDTYQFLSIATYFWPLDLVEPDPIDKNYHLHVVATQPAVVSQGNFSLRIHAATMIGTYWVVPVVDQPNYEKRDIRNDCYQVQ